jgi:hypothetical protein
LVLGGGASLGYQFDEGLGAFSFDGTELMPIKRGLNPRLFLMFHCLRTF